MKPGHEHHGALHAEVQGERDERSADQAHGPELPCLRTSASSQSTTVDAPISIRLSRPKPASATDRADSAAIASDDDADDIPSQRHHLEEPTAGQ